MLPALVPIRFLWLHKNMGQAMENMQPQKRGRPATGKGAPVQVRLQPELLTRLDAERAKHDPEPSRPEMIRMLLEEQLK